MIGAVIGDIIGSHYEWHNVKTKDFDLFPSDCRFTDDSVLSVAVAEKLLRAEGSNLNNKKTYAMWIKHYFGKFSDAGFGQMFKDWAYSDSLYVQKSYGNGAAMRVTAIAYAFDNLKDVLREVEDSCYYTHKNKEAITGAKAVATAIFMARNNATKNEIKQYIEKVYHYELIPLDDIREDYTFDSRASYTVPPAIEAFIESDSYEDAIRNAVSIGGDSDTIACMTGGIAEAYYKEIPQPIIDKARLKMDAGLKRVMGEFMEKYCK